jgi:hypothetical protein
VPKGNIQYSLTCLNHNIYQKKYKLKNLETIPKIMNISKPAELIKIRGYLLY